MRLAPVLLLLIAGFCGAAPHVAVAQGSIAFAASSIDLGEVATGDRTSAVFEYSNAGQEGARIVEVRPSCGCTVPEFDAGLLEPGDGGTLVVEFDAGSRRGPFRHTVAIEFEGSGSWVEQVEISGTVVPGELIDGDRQGSVRFDEADVDLGEVPAHSALQHRFLMQHLGGREITIQSSHAFPEGVTVSSPARPFFGDEVIHLVVDVPANLVEGRFEIAIALETDDRDEPVKVLTMVGDAIDP